VTRQAPSGRTYGRSSRGRASCGHDRGYSGRVGEWGRGNDDGSLDRLLVGLRLGVVLRLVSLVAEGVLRGRRKTKESARRSERESDEGVEERGRTTPADRRVPIEAFESLATSLLISLEAFEASYGARCRVMPLEGRSASLATARRSGAEPDPVPLLETPRPLAVPRPIDRPCLLLLDARSRGVTPRPSAAAFIARSAKREREGERTCGSVSRFQTPLAIR
jgi:hypothetical protein